jgi:hypothetical protein
VLAPNTGRIIRGAMSEEYLRTIAAHFYAVLVMQIAREKFGKSLFVLSPDQERECQNQAYAMVRLGYVSLSPEAIRKMAEPDPPPMVH